MHVLSLNQIIYDKVKQTNKQTDFQWINTSVCLSFQTFMTSVEYTMTFEEPKSLKKHLKSMSAKNYSENQFKIIY